jgi:D-ribose pyranose/furanose isomerase RbsD
MIENETVLQMEHDVTYQDMGPDQPAVILQLSTGQLFTCNETTRMFLERLDGQRNFGQVVEVLLDEYDVDSIILAADLRQLGDELLAAGLIHCL